LYDQSHLSGRGTSGLPSWLGQAVAQFGIEFHTSFLVETTLDVIRTMDCGGAGKMSFEIGDVEAGVYSIWIGNKTV
jgi:hypothetical protein